MVAAATEANVVAALLEPRTAGSLRIKLRSLLFAGG